MAKFRYNLDQEARDKIIWGEEGPQPITTMGGNTLPLYAGGVQRFEGLTTQKLQELIQLRFADPMDNQNDSPTMREFLDFALSNPHIACTFGGYAVECDRPDHRITIDSVSIENFDAITKDEVVNWFMFARYADELEKDRAWWD